MQSYSKFSVPEKIQALPANRGAFFHVPLYFSCLSFARYIIILQTKELSMNQANVEVSFYLKKSCRATGVIQMVAVRSAVPSGAVAEKRVF